MTTDVHSLTGAYVLDAVSEHELRVFERHLAGCESCACEVTGLRETAAKLGLAAALDPPAHLRSTVLNRIRRIRQGPKPVAARLFASAAAVLLVVATALGVLVVRQGQALDNSRQDTAAMTAILRAADADVTREDGVTLVVSHAQNRLLLLAGALPPPPNGRDYQAWLVDTDYRSAGVLTDHTTATIDTATRVALTLEPDGGSPQPTTTPFLSIPLP